MKKLALVLSLISLGFVVPADAQILFHAPGVTVAVPFGYYPYYGTWCDFHPNACWHHPRGGWYRPDGDWRRPEGFRHEERHEHEEHEHRR